jgi:hypothetical protein
LPVGDAGAGGRDRHHDAVRLGDGGEVEHGPVLGVLLGLLLEQPDGLETVAQLLALPPPRLCVSQLPTAAESLERA